jgi:hypothetical protein
MPRFVVHEHDHPTLHWDLMLDAGESLRSWRLDALPQAGIETTCVSTPDHRRAYLDYEGPVSRNRGSVKRVLTGEYSIVDETDLRLHLLLMLPGQGLEVTLSPTVGPGTATIRAC